MTNKYDIPAPDFDADLAFGISGEDVVRDFIHEVLSGSFEVKTDRYRNGRMVVETQQNPRKATDETGNPIWVNSGINVTEAKWWVYQYALDGAFHVVAVSRLRRYLKKNKDKFNNSTKKVFAESSDNPAKGFLLYPEHVFDLLTNPEYDRDDV